ncbi:MAG: AAA family ATPase [Nitrospiraceae bacterium]
MTATATSVHDLRALVRSCHPLIVIETVEEDRIHQLLQSVARQERIPLYEWSITRGLTKAEDGDTINRMTAPPLALLQHLGGLTLDALFWLKDLGAHLSDAATARQLRDVVHHFARTRATCVVTGDPVTLPADLDKAAIRYELRLPDRDELHTVVQSVLQSLRGQQTPSLARATSETTPRVRPATRPAAPTLSPADYERILRALNGMTLHQARQTVSQCLIEDGSLTADDLQTILARKAQAIKEGGLLEYYPVEDNRYELGGFAALKRWLDRAKVGFTPEAKALNLAPPRGLLLVGVPGCGKSLAAKAIARDWGVPLLKLDAGRLFDKFVGESEKNFRKAIAMAESLAPIVLWIDELEKAMVAGGSDTDGGLSRRLFGAFLTWMQEKRQEVFVVATANDLSALPPELLRKGRFDEIFFVDLPDEAERQAIWTIHLRIRKQDPARFDIPRIVSASDGFSGAEIEQAVVAGLYRALHAKQPLAATHLLDELSQTVPLSVSRHEDIDRLRTLAQERFVNVR